MRDQTSVVNYFDSWAEIYDWVYAWKRDDIHFYVEQARLSGGPVLELGSGTGRIAITIAQAGIEVVGLESSAAMLAEARRKTGDATGSSHAAPVWVEGDMRDFSLGRRFALVIIPFRGFLSLLSVHEQLECLRCIREHLAPGGRLVLDVFVPDLDMLTDDDSTPIYVEDVPHPHSDRRLVIWHHNRFDNHNQINNARTIIEELDAAGEMVRRLYREFQVRYMHRFEAQHLLELAGFQVEELFGDFELGPFDEDSADMVWVASLAETPGQDSSTPPLP